MSPTWARKGPKRWRDYVSQSVLQGEKAKAGSIARIPAAEIENRVADALGKIEPRLGSGGHCVRNVFLPPTALKLMRQVPNPRPAFPLHCVRSGAAARRSAANCSTGAAGISVSPLTSYTAKRGVTWWCRIAPRSWRRGRATWDAQSPVTTSRFWMMVALSRQSGAEVEIAVRRPDPVMFLRYWSNPEATARKFSGEWLLTGDRGRRDGEGHLCFMGRD